MNPSISSPEKTPFWAFVPVGLLAATVLVVVAVESSARRRERLGQVLRVR